MNTPVVLVVLGLALASMCLVFGGALGALLVLHLARSGRAPQPSPVPTTIEVDEAAAIDQLAQLAAVVARLHRLGKPELARTAVADMRNPDLVAVWFIAAMAAIATSPDAVTRIRAMADELVVAKLLDLPTVERDP